MKKKEQTAGLILRLGLASVFLYAAIGSLAAPNDWVGYLPSFATSIVPAGLLLKLFSVYELFLTGWLLSGKFVRWAGVMSALTMVGIIFSDLKLLPITFRDIAIAAGAVALAVLAE